MKCCNDDVLVRWIMPSGKKRTHSEFVSELSKINSSIQVLGTYEKNVLPVLCRCSICGYEWDPIPKALLNGHGCPCCANNLKLSMTDFIALLKKNNSHFDTFTVIGNYEGMSQKIKCKCLVCDTEWYPKANDLIRVGSGCPSCSGHIKYTHNRFLKEFKQKNKNSTNIEVLSQYRGMTERIQCKCTQCQHIWNPIASSLIQGTGCPECSKIKVAERGREQLKIIKRPGKMSHADFLAKFNKKNPYANNIEICSTYDGALNSVSCRCKICGFEWDTIASGLLQGTGCPSCAHTSTSFMEQFLLIALSKAVYPNKVIHRDKNTIGKEIDVFLPDYNFAIEIGSWKWHKPILDRDIEKVKDCHKQGVRLITIYDSYHDNTLLGQDIWTYGIDLGSEKNCTTLKQIVQACLKSISVSYLFTEQEWEEIISLAYNSSCRVLHEEFMQKLKQKNTHYDDLIIQSKYKYAKDKIKCKCRICEHEWETAASELLKGTGCPICQIKLVGERKSKKALILKWRKENPNGTKMQCEKATGISRMTIYKWWDSIE